MPLLRAMARTAAVAGTATAVSNRVSRRQAGRWADQDQAPPPEQDEAQPPPDAMEAKLAQLKSLGELKAQRVLTDAEFEAEKKKVLHS